MRTRAARLRKLGLYGLCAQADTLLTEPWLARVIDIEETERARRSLKRRLDNARLGAFKPIADFDWSWPTKCDRAGIEELFSLAFLAEATNVVLIGPNGLGKTMLLKNLAHQAILHGHSARFTLASDMLHDLAAQDSTVALARRLRRYTRSALLAIDEVGYLSYDPRYADLLFEVITRRYELQRPILLSTNKAFGEWNQVFPNAACVVALVDRLLHRAEIVTLEGKSYRFKEAQERAARKVQVAHPITQTELTPCSSPTTCRSSACPWNCLPLPPPSWWPSCTNSPTPSNATTAHRSSTTMRPRLVQRVPTARRPTVLIDRPCSAQPSASDPFRAHPQNDAGLQSRQQLPPLLKRFVPVPQRHQMGAPYRYSTILLPMRRSFRRRIDATMPKRLHTSRTGCPAIRSASWQTSVSPGRSWTCRKQVLYSVVSTTTTKLRRAFSMAGCAC